MKPVAIRSFFQLIRFKVSLAVTFSAFAAEVISSGHIYIYLLFPALGIFLLASGASALNQFQERIFDSRMDRTKNRPLPSAKMKPAMALGLSIILLSLGFLSFTMEGLWICLLLGAFNILWYNGFYTWLKTKTAFAVVPGAFTGAIPVLMGWSAAGGSIFDRIPLFLAFFIFLWQIPHFWLLMLKYGDEYHNAGLPVLSEIFSVPQMKRIIMFWLLAASMASLLLLSACDRHLSFINLTVIVLNIALLLLVIFQFFISGSIKYRILFASVNFFMLFVLLLLTIGRILN